MFESDSSDEETPSIYPSSEKLFKIVANDSLAEKQSKSRECFKIFDHIRKPLYYTFPSGVKKICKTDSALLVLENSGKLHYGYRSVNFKNDCAVSMSAPTCVSGDVMTGLEFKDTMTNTEFQLRSNSIEPKSQHSSHILNFTKLFNTEIKVKNVFCGDTIILVQDEFQ